jgi:hypothetical protein
LQVYCIVGILPFFSFVLSFWIFCWFGLLCFLWFVYEFVFFTPLVFVVFYTAFNWLYIEQVPILLLLKIREKTKTLYMIFPTEQ